MQQTFLLSHDKLPHHPAEFIESDSNSLAYRAVCQWQRRWGTAPYPRTLLIEGPACSGKSYLANIWLRAGKGLIITKDQTLTIDLIDRYEQFVIENIEDHWDQLTLLHYFNLINENQKYLLLTQAGKVDFNLPDLASRIRAVNKILIAPPDDKLMRILIFKIFSSCSVVVGPKVISYMLKIIPREFQKIIYYTNLINDYALTSQKKITISLLKKLLNHQA